MARTLSSLPLGSIIVDKGSNYNNQNIELIKIADDHPGFPAGSSLFATKKIMFKAYDSKEVSSDIYLHKVNGNPSYMYSNIRQWLNSDYQGWFSKSHEFDEPPRASTVTYNSYDVEKGFMLNFSPYLRKNIMETSVITSGQIVKDYVFLASETEITGVGNEGIQFQYFKDNISNADANYTDNAIASDEYYRMSKDLSANRLSYYTRTPSNDGGIKNIIGGGDILNVTNLSHGIYAVRAFMNIDSSILVDDEPVGDKYVVKSNRPPSSSARMTTPVNVTAGEDFNINWEKAEDRDYNLEGYIVERSDSSMPFRQVYRGSRLFYTDRIESKTSSIQYRVKSYDSYGSESTYTYSELIEVHHKNPPYISGEPDTNLGNRSEKIDIVFSVNDSNREDLNIKVVLNNRLVEEKYEKNNSIVNYNMTDKIWRELKFDLEHTITVTVSNKYSSANKTYRFVKVRGKHQEYLSLPDRNFKVGRQSEQLLNDELYRQYESIKHLTEVPKEANELPKSNLHGALWLDFMKNELNYFDRNMNQWKNIFEDKFRLTSEMLNKFPPARPVTGQMWLNEEVLMYYDGKTWRPIKALDASNNNMNTNLFEDFLLMSPLTSKANDIINAGDRIDKTKEQYIVPNVNIGKFFMNNNYRSDYETVNNVAIQYPKSLLSDGNIPSWVHVNPGKLTKVKKRLFRIDEYSHFIPVPTKDTEYYGFIAGSPYGYFLTPETEENMGDYEVSNDGIFLNKTVYGKYKYVLAVTYEFNWINNTGTVNKITDIKKLNTFYINSKSSNVNVFIDGYDLEGKYFVFKKEKELLTINDKNLKPNMEISVLGGENVQYGFIENISEDQKFGQFRMRKNFRSPIIFVNGQVMHPTLGGCSIDDTNGIVTIEGAKQGMCFTVYESEGMFLQSGKVTEELNDTDLITDIGRNLLINDDISITSSRYPVAVSKEEGYTRIVPSKKSGIFIKFDDYIGLVRKNELKEDRYYFIEEMIESKHTYKIPISMNIRVDISKLTKNVAEENVKVSFEAQHKFKSELMNANIKLYASKGMIERKEIEQPLGTVTQLKADGDWNKYELSVPKNTLEGYSYIDVEIQTDKDAEESDGVHIKNIKVEIVNEVNDPATEYSISPEDIVQMGIKTFITIDDYINKVPEKDNIILSVDGLMLSKEDLIIDKAKGTVSCKSLKVGQEYVLLLDKNNSFYSSENIKRALYTGGKLDESMVYINGRLICNETAVLTPESEENIKNEVRDNEIKFFIKTNEAGNTVGEFKYFNGYHSDFEDLPHKEIEYVKQITSSYNNGFETVNINMNYSEDTDDIQIYAYNYSSSINNPVIITSQELLNEQDIHIRDRYIPHINAIQVYLDGIRQYEFKEKLSGDGIILPERYTGKLTYIIEKPEKGHNTVCEREVLNSSKAGSEYNYYKTARSLFPGRVVVYVNGLRQPRNSYIVLDNNTIMFKDKETRLIGSEKNYPKEHTTDMKNEIVELNYKNDDEILVEVRQEFKTQEYAIETDNEINEIDLDGYKIPKSILQAEEEIKIYIDGIFTGALNGSGYIKDQNIGKLILNDSYTKDITRDELEEFILSNVNAYSKWKKKHSKTAYDIKRKHVILLEWR